jgi:Rhs element Vgr protein
MPAERTLPIAAEHREFTVKVDGSALGREHHLVSASIRAQAGRIASARLAYVDGAASQGNFALSAGDVFVPGKPVEIVAEGGAQAHTLFKGVIVGQSLRVRDHSAPQLVVECRHAALKLAAAPRSANRFDVSDSEVIEALLQAAGVDVEVERTRVKHAQLVQLQCSDWDFALARARANGLLVCTRAAKVAVIAPTLDAAPVAKLQFGATVLEFDGEIDARTQYKTVQARAWNAADQKLAVADGDAPALKPPGNFDTDALAGVGGAALRLDHAAMDAAEAQAWADAARRDAALAQVRGRIKCVGLGNVLPGDVIELDGMGARFNGKLLVTGVRHELDTVQGWRTHLQFGDDGADEAHVQRLAERASRALVAPVHGLQIGVVTSNEDPAGEHRVRVRLPLVDAGDDGLWARVASLDAGKQRGFFFRPEIGDEVVIGFLDDDPRHPVLLGMLHSSAHAAPLAGKDANPEKAYVSRSGMRVHFDDDKKVLTLDTPAGNSLVFSEDQKSIVLADQHGNRIALTSEGITIESAKALTVKATTEAKLEAGTSLGVHGGTQLELQGGASAELKSSGTAKLTGALVQIN